MVEVLASLFVMAGAFGQTPAQRKTRSVKHAVCEQQARGEKINSTKYSIFIHACMRSNSGSPF